MTPQGQDMAESKAENSTARRGGPRARTFCTYLTGTLEEIEDKIKNIQQSVAWYAGQLEQGREGMIHLQLTFGYNNQRSLNNIQLSLPDGANVQVARDPAASIKYSTDESKRYLDKLYIYGDVPTFQRSNNQQTNTLFEEAKATGSLQAALKYIEQKDITTYIYQMKKLHAYFENYFAASDNSKFKPEDFNRPLYQFPPDKTLVFVGETGLGKTQFALAHFNHPLRITNKQDWIRFRDGYTDGIVFDDIHFSDWKPNTILHTVDTENAVTQDVKYSAVRIPAGVPRIICINSLGELWPCNIDSQKKEAIERRLSVIRILGPLYNNKSQ